MWQLVHLDQSRKHEFIGHEESSDAKKALDRVEDIDATDSSSSKSTSHTSI